MANQVTVRSVSEFSPACGFQFVRNEDHALRFFPVLHVVRCVQYETRNMIVLEDTRHWKRFKFPVVYGSSCTWVQNQGQGFTSIEPDLRMPYVYPGARSKLGRNSLKTELRVTLVDRVKQYPD